MRASTREFVKICSEVIDFKEPIYEFGALQVSKDSSFSDLRPFFTGKRYIGSDIREGPGVDLVLDLHNLNLASDSVGTALLIDTLEHVEYPHRAMDEIYRVLMPSGIVILTSVMNFPIHNHPYDYWRFTPEAIKSLLSSFETILIGYVGESRFPHLVWGIGIKGDIDDGVLRKLKARLETWSLKYYSTAKFSLKRIFYLISPMFLIERYRIYKDKKNRKEISNLKIFKNNRLYNV
jgi:SAM-dependent methyltransferase